MAPAGRPEAGGQRRVMPPARARAEPRAEGFHDLISKKAKLSSPCLNTGLFSLFSTFDFGLSTSLMKTHRETRDYDWWCSPFSPRLRAGVVEIYSATHGSSLAGMT